MTVGCNLSFVDVGAIFRFLFEKKRTENNNIK